MSRWLRPLTYIAAGACGVAAVLWPSAAPILTPAATALAGWATAHPSDKIDKAAIIDLATQSASGAARATAALTRSE